MEFDLERLGVHESVDAVFPPGELADYLADLPVTVDVISDDEIATCDAVVTVEHRRDLLECAWVHSIQAGVDRFPFDAFEEHDVVLTNSTGMHDRTVGETVAGYLLSFSRRLHDLAANQQERRWERPAWDEAFTLPGTTACVVGTGTLGRGVAETVGALGVRVTGVRRSDESVPGFEEIYTTDDVHAAIADAEFVVATVPLTEETHHLFDAEAFETMRDDAYFVNVARGAVVDQDALIAALESGAITGAALDVFEAEPLPESSPLWELDEVIVTPHCAAYTEDYYRDVGEIVRENVSRLEGGEDVHNRVV
ncbi:D-2-hydroxyacid dehydrogenase [Natronolimnohabitans sp. A-GB9]|uniref:D-2-hydroxyacid dehydrogenase n=1 Tax=Natronolimnohabitans sp. A-GB9 TaxID=3069757 RepID=UPI0027B8316B|nr:D-2-hydroxyacid dehydrogenase [Natronolimnohabitans sp. A-GB9]MDQ2051161.1 D-2-hydroxyacid dehydrogenase [Natronolimnohabitans sp. A-GB9]